MKKNILLITSDQHHFSCMGYNNPELKTPNLDRLAQEGMIFDRAYCPNPTCTPTRASIITGYQPESPPHAAGTAGASQMPRGDRMAASRTSHPVRMGSAQGKPVCFEIASIASVALLSGMPDVFRATAATLPTCSGANDRS